MRTDISTKVSLTIAAAFLVLTVAVLAIVASGSLGLRQAAGRRPAGIQHAGGLGRHRPAGPGLSAARATSSWSATMR
jgi:hypothetical protein